MRISDWSSDVCSSDLQDSAVHEEALAALLDDADWASRAADAQVDRLHGVLDGTAPAAQPAGENDVAASTLAVFREARELRRTHGAGAIRSEEHTSELQSLMRISYAVFCLKKKKKKNNTTTLYSTPL